MAKADTSALIAEAVNAGIQAGREQALSTLKDLYKETERRLYALPVLELKVIADKEALEEMRSDGVQPHSKSIIRFSRVGYRADPVEMAQEIMNELEANIANCEYEIRAVRRALETISSDPYYPTVEGRYILGLEDDVVAARIPCDMATAWRNRKRLVQRLAVWFFGIDAI